MVFINKQTVHWVYHKAPTYKCEDVLPDSELGLFVWTHVAQWDGIS